MTAQIPDSIVYCGKKYTYIKSSNDFGFNPEDFGVKPMSFITSNWRGFFCDYLVDCNEGMLYLEKLTISGGSKKLTALLGRYRTGSSNYGNVYDGIKIKMKYTGKLLLGREFINKYYVHGGFQESFAYKKVIELIFSEGKMIEAIDHSDYVEKHRDKLLDKLTRGRKGSQSVLKSIATFLGSYQIEYWWERML